MKTKTLFFLSALMAGLSLILAGRVTAQTFATLYRFTVTSGPPYMESDGAYPFAGLILSGNTLYGTTYGGASGCGTVFRVNTDGTGFTNLHNFTGLSSPPFTNSDGCGPQAELILSGNTLYGTASGGGSFGYGTVFAVNTDGTGFTNLHNFTAIPGPPYTNSDGCRPEAGLILSGNTLYGTASRGGSSRHGTVFAVNIDGGGFTNLHNFTAIPGPPYTNSDGCRPEAGLILSGNTLYGTASRGGSSRHGTVFAVNIDGGGFTNLHNFTAGTDSFTGCCDYTNSDGGDPRGGLILSGNTLFGTTPFGGSSGNGTVFAVNTDGGFTNLHSFTANPGGLNSDGAFPVAGLILAGNTLYGTANGGGYGIGTVFSLTFTPQLTVIPFGTNLVLTWPTNVAGFDYTGYLLQSTTDLVSAAIWTAVSPGPVVLNGQNAVTNLISGTQKFFRLSQ